VLSSKPSSPNHPDGPTFKLLSAEVYRDSSIHSLGSRLPEISSIEVDQDPLELLLIHLRFVERSGVWI
jgi:hypothetical protein